jgi:tellurite resistance protein TehA-like permease
MATGVIGVSARLLHIPVLPALLAVVAGVSYTALLAATLLRLVRHGEAVREDFKTAHRAPGFLTTVAATCVLGTEAALFGGSVVAYGLWLLGAGLWAILVYAVVAGGPRLGTPTADPGGTWLLLTVATQSVTVLGALIGSQAAVLGPAWLFGLLALWVAGCVLYVLVIVPVFQRMRVAAAAPARFAFSYWISMGALAISTLAGAGLSPRTEHSTLFHTLLPFVQGGTLVCWAAGSWWIPWLAVLTVRRVTSGVPFGATADYWAFVFPLGMYSAATYQLASVLRLPALIAVARAFLAIAVAAWVVGVAASAARLRAEGANALRPRTGLP